MIGNIIVYTILPVAAPFSRIGLMHDNTRTNLIDDMITDYCNEPNDVICILRVLGESSVTSLMPSERLWLPIGHPPISISANITHTFLRTNSQLSV